MEFSNEWLWLIIVIIGLLLILMELIAGVNAQLDLVFIGSSFILGGLITYPFSSWISTVIVSGAICIIYVVIGRRFIHRWAIPKRQQTNIDTIIGKKGFVTRDITRRGHGVVRIGTETWRATSDDEIGTDSEIEVTEVKGITLTVRKYSGGN